MKNAITSILHKPLYVTVLSLIVAGSIGFYEYQQFNIAPAYQFVKATSGSIASSVTADGDSQHVSLSFSVSGRVSAVSVKVGDTVKKGMTLVTLDPESTLGAMTQAQAAYASAQANYQKVLHGATTETVNVANSSIATAQQNLNHVVQNAFTQVDNIIRTNVDSLYLYPNANEPQFQVTFFDVSANSNIILTPPDTNQRLDLGNKKSDLNVLLKTWKSSASASSVTTTTGSIDDTTVQTTLKNLGAVRAYLDAVSDGLTSLSYNSKYQGEIEKHKSEISAAKSTIDALINTIQSNQLALQSAKTSVTAVTTTARPEDIAVAQAQMNNALGALQIAEASYHNRSIVSPGDGVVTALRISAGESVTPNTTIVELTGQNFSKSVALMVPRNTIIERNGKNFVLVKNVSVPNGVEEKEVILGASDNQYVEVVSGLRIADEVAVR